jgi:hypothetical protein
LSRYNENMCRPFVGRMVHVHTTKGIHRGYVENVTQSGLYLRPVSDGGHAAAYDFEQNITTAEQLNEQLDARNVWYRGYGYRGYGGYGGYGYGYGPYAAARFFVPFLTILALTSLLWW